MNRDIKFTRYHEIIKALSSKKAFNITELTLFCEYISSNPYFEYNGTYLRDSLEDFEEIINISKIKHEITKNFQNELKKKYKNIKDWYIVFDSFYILLPDLSLRLLPDYIIEIEKSDPEKSKIFRKIADNFNLFKYNENSISVEYISIKIKEQSIQIERQYRESHEITSKLNLFPIIESQLA